MPYLDKVIDLSHYQTHVDFTKVASGGFLGTLHKATEGRTGKDERCKPRRDLALMVGLLYGTYHFGTNGNIKEQIDNYLLSYVEGDLLALDMERSGKVTDTSMALDYGEAFEEAVRVKLGRTMMIYGGGDYLRDVLNPPASSPLGRCPLWWAKYSDTAPTRLPACWKEWTFWQYTCEGTVPGITGNVDRNRFQGDEAQLRALWTGEPVRRVMRAPVA